MRADHLPAGRPRRARRGGSAGCFLENGRWERLVAIVLGLLLAVALERAVSAALRLFGQPGAPPGALAASVSAGPRS